MALIKLISGKEIKANGNEIGMSPVGLTYRPSSVILPDGSYDVCLIPWQRIDSFTDTVNPAAEEAAARSRFAQESNGPGELS